MIGTIGRPSRIKDSIGVAVLAGTALLYAFQASHAGAGEACASCEAEAAAQVAPPADTPPPAESLISTTPDGDSVAILQPDALLS